MPGSSWQIMWLVPLPQRIVSHSLTSAGSKIVCAAKQAFAVPVPQHPLATDNTIVWHMLLPGHLPVPDSEEWQQQAQRLQALDVLGQ